MSDQVEAAVAQAFREERALVLATLIRQVGDFQLAEDAVQDAFEAAVTVWRRDGIPANPGAWITTAARRRAIDRLRRNQSIADRAERVADLMRLDDQHEEPAMDDESAIVDDRLRLIFTCCHPALDTAGARGAHAARARGPDHRRDRPCVPGRGADDGQADRACQAQDRRRPHPVPGAGRRGAARPPARRPAGRVPDLQRGLRGHRGRSARARRAVRRGAPPRRPARAPDARRRRGLGAVGADAAARRAPRRPRRRERQLRRARRPGPVALGSWPAG